MRKGDRWEAAVNLPGSRLDIAPATLYSRCIAKCPTMSTTSPGAVLRPRGHSADEDAAPKGSQQRQHSEAEAGDIVLADVLPRGRRRDDNTEVYVVVEVSWRADPYDVEQAVRHATLLGLRVCHRSPSLRARRSRWKPPAWQKCSVSGRSPMGRLCHPGAATPQTTNLPSSPDSCARYS